MSTNLVFVCFLDGELFSGDRRNRTVTAAGGVATLAIEASLRFSFTDIRLVGVCSAKLSATLNSAGLSMALATSEFVGVLSDSAMFSFFTDLFAVKDLRAGCGVLDISSSSSSITIVAARLLRPGVLRCTGTTSSSSATVSATFMVRRERVTKVDEATDALSSDVKLVRRVDRRPGVPGTGMLAAAAGSTAPELRRVARRPGAGELFRALTFSSVSADATRARVLRTDVSSKSAAFLCSKEVSLCGVVVDWLLWSRSIVSKVVFKCLNY